MVVHPVDEGQGFYTHSLTAKQVAALLEAFFDGNRSADDFTAGRSDDFTQTFERLAVGKEVIHKQDAVTAVEILLFHHDGIVGVVGIGVNNCSADVTGEVAGAVLLGKNHWDVQGSGSREGQRFQW